MAAGPLDELEDVFADLLRAEADFVDRLHRGVRAGAFSVRQAAAVTGLSKSQVARLITYQADRPWNQLSAP